AHLSAVISAGASATHIYDLSLHDALPIYTPCPAPRRLADGRIVGRNQLFAELMKIVDLPVLNALTGDVALPDHTVRYGGAKRVRSEEHTSELQSRENLVCRLLLVKKKHVS